jgi:hypothetical protein
MPRSPALHASPAELDAAEAKLDLPQLIRQGVAGTSLESYRYVAGRVESAEVPLNRPKQKQGAAIA